LPEYQKAYDIDPTDAGNAYALAGALYYLQGESETVLGLFRKAIELDPVNSQPYAAIGAYYYEAGKLPEAEAAIRKAIDLSPPTGTSLHGWLGYILLVRGRPDEALAEFRREPDEIYHRQGAALAYFALGRRAEADAALAEMERKDALTYASGIAETYAYRGEIEPAFTWLDRAYRQRDAFLSALKRDPLMKSLHADPRWKAFLRKLE
jgi:tetratricopeptide (TPR) repeat protein